MIVIAIDPLWKHLESIKRQFSIAIIALLGSNFFSRKFFLLFFSAERRSIRGSFSSREEQCFRRTVFFTRSRNRIKEEDVRVYP